ncbi:MAG: CDP-diacylglycerol--glycerol-3-phosphate 3-phosphatidyltransferase [Bacilli bacterium]|nr:CDP-diacylglycerol--glycerol-3-phosphate 3-phosphatidyltransferase [Bacilli bacterium]
MNLPNKITMGRMVISILILVILLFPWYQVGIAFPEFVIKGRVIVDLKYIICGVLFVIASLSDFFDGYIARKYKLVTDFGKVMDAIADKILVNGLLIILACNGFISMLVPVVIITRDTFTDALKAASSKKGKVIGASFAGKTKTMVMMIGITLVMFYNLPFELISSSIRVDEAIVLIATVLSVISGIQYYLNCKDYLFSDK